MVEGAPPNRDRKHAERAAPDSQRLPTSKAASAQGKAVDDTPGLLKYADFDYAAFFRRRNVRVLVAVIIAIVALIFGYWLRDIFIPVLVALLLAYILNPVVEWCQRRGLSRIWSVSVVFVGFFALLAATVVVALPPVLSNGQNIVEFVNTPNHLASTATPQAPQDPAPLPAATPVTYTDEEAAWIDGYTKSHGSTRVVAEDELRVQQRKLLENPFGKAIDEWNRNQRVPEDFKRSREEIRVWLRRVVSTEAAGVATDVAGAMMSVFLFIILVPMFTFYFLLGLDRIWERMTAYLPGRHRDRVVGILKEIHIMVSAFFRGRLVICVMVAAATVALFVATGVPYGVILGLLGGFGVIIPFFPMLFSLLPAVLLLMLSTDASPTTIAVIAAAFLLIQGLEMFVLTPKILGKAIQLHPVTIIVGIFVMSSLFGFFGALLAVPLTAIAKILGREFILPYFKALADEDPTRSTRSVSAPSAKPE